MLHFNTTETFLRKADDTCYGITLVVSVYKDPIVMETVLIRDEFDDPEPTIEVSRPDWGNNTALSSRELTYLIPTNKQTTTFPTPNRETNTAFNDLLFEWRSLYADEPDYIQIQDDLLSENHEHDGHYES